MGGLLWVAPQDLRVRAVHVGHPRGSVRGSPYSHEHMFLGSRERLLAWLRSVDQVVDELLAGDAIEGLVGFGLVLEDFETDQKRVPARRSDPRPGVPPAGSQIFAGDRLATSYASDGASPTAATPSDERRPVERRPHPHRRLLSRRFRSRRPGALPPPPAVCISPLPAAPACPATERVRGA